MQTPSLRRSHVHERIQPVKPTYEPGMKVSYDPTTHRVVVAFRGRITVIPGTYDSELRGIAAGEAHCRGQGWKPRDESQQKKSRFNSWV